jgi:hypothetical protein
MFVGHFGIAQFGKGARREVPLALLVISAYLPDIVRVALDPFTARSEVLSHAIPVVVALALMVAVLWLLRGGRFAAAGILAIVCLLHWPADLFTGCKPVMFDGPWFGWVSYRRPVNDLVVEGALIVGGWIYARRRGFAMAKKWLAVAFALQLAFLVTMYWGSEFIIGSHEWTWKPHESLVPVPQALEQTPCRAPGS